MKKFALVGAAGYIAPRHMKAIKDTGNFLIAALDKNDSIGVIDNYFPDSEFFLEFEQFDQYLERLKQRGTQLDYLSICTPNHLHESHIKFGLKNNADVVCEKPIVLHPSDIDIIERLELETGRRVYSILQLRHHPSVIELKQKVDRAPKDKIYDIDLTYLTSRGKWYYASWKGDQDKSGGIASNIGIHFFDMLGWIFGEVCHSVVHYNDVDKMAGYLEFKRARVRWFLSIDYALLPQEVKKKGGRTYRSIKIEENEFEFSGGFTDLHTRCYEEILSGEGCRIGDARNVIELVHSIRKDAPVGLKGDYHPLL